MCLVRRAVQPNGIRLWAALWTVLFLFINRAPIFGRAAPIWDAKDSFFPFFVLTADHARAGRLVAWDLWSNAGLPRIGDPEFGAVWPLQLLVGLVFGGTPSGFIAYWMSIWWLGGLGMFLLARHLGAPGWGAFVVVSGYAWSGIYTGHAQHISWLVGFSSLPYVIWRLDAALTTGRWSPAVQSGAIWGAAATASYPGVTIVTAVLMAVWTVFRLAITSDRPEATNARAQLRHVWARSAMALCTAGVMGLICLLPTYVSFFREAAGVHVRQEALARSEAVDNNALDPGALVTGISPHFASLKYHRSSPPLWPRTDVSSVSIYTGAVTLALAFAALAMAPHAGWRWALAASALLWVGIAVGSVLPLRGLLYDWVYPTRFFRHSALFRLYFIFTVSVLALIGARGLARTFQNSRPARRRCCVVFMSVAVVASVVYWAARPADAAAFPDAALGTWHLLVIWGGIAAAAVLALASRGAWLLPVLLVGIATADAFLTAALTRHTMVSSTPGDVAWWHGESQLHDPDVDLTGEGLTRTLRPCESNPPCTEPNTWGMITKVPALSTYTASTNPFFDGSVEDPTVAASAVGAQRIWFSPDVARVDLDPDAFRRFVDRTRALGGIPIVVHAAASMRNPARRADPVTSDTFDQLPRAHRIPVRVDRYDTVGLQMSIDTPSAGWVLVTERWAPSWRAEIDGRPVPILGGNFVFRAVHVPQGRHTVEFTFAPVALPWLVVTSWTTMLVVAAASLAARRGQQA